MRCFPFKLTPETRYLTLADRPELSRCVYKTTDRTSAARVLGDNERDHIYKASSNNVISPAYLKVPLDCKRDICWAGGCCCPLRCRSTRPYSKCPVPAGVENVGTPWTGKARADDDKDASKLYTASHASLASFVFPLTCKELPNKLSFSLITESISLSTMLQTA